MFTRAAFKLALCKQGSSLACIFKAKSLFSSIKESETPLIRHMKDMIKWNGPLSVAQYMRQSLTNSLGGYYMTQRVFGREGDFVTSPDISQIFGELIAVWFLTHYLNTGNSKTTQLIELGPGRGTLMADILRTLQDLKSVFTSDIKFIHLVEASPRLREIQLETICGSTVASMQLFRDEFGRLEAARTENGLELRWYENLDDIQQEHWTMLIAHEFFDALPVYKFKKTEHGWREIMVDVEDDPKTLSHFRYVLAPTNTPSLELLANSQLSFSNNYDSCAVGATIEISPEAGSYAQSIADYVQIQGGAALVIDYGGDGPSEGSLRAIKDHQFVDLFTSPGKCDLSANVDFSLLRNAIGDKALTFGPMTQRQFLLQLGIQLRLKLLLKAVTSVEQRELLEKSYDRLTSQTEMGNVYKCFAIISKDSSGVPIGFEQSNEAY